MLRVGGYLLTQHSIQHGLDTFDMADHYGDAGKAALSFRNFDMVC